MPPLRSLSPKLLVGVLLTVPATVHAQDAERDDRRLVSVAASVGVAALPDILGAQCGSKINGAGGAGLEGGAALLVRPRRWLVLQADVRATRQYSNDCIDIGVPADTVYARELRQDPLGTATARIGVETPAGLPLARATVGLGTVWGGRSRPVAVAGLGIGTRGRRVRALLELDRFWTREESAQERIHGTGSTMIDVVRSIVVRPAWYTGRLGLELPIHAGR